MTDASDDFDEAEARDAADAVYGALLARVGEGSPRPRLAPTRRAVELLGDPHRSAPVIHITGTNGKTSTSRMIESLLRASGLRTGLLTSPHLERFTERIRIDGEPISDEAVARNWDEIVPFIAIVDSELDGAGEDALTFFETLTVLAFASFADAPVDVVVLEVGMGGEWDSTNVADGQVAVFTPIDLDHQTRLGTTITEIARTKSGIIKPAASVVSARQPDAALAVLEEAADLTESSLALEGDAFDVLESRVAVGGQLVTIRGLAGEYRDIALPLFGRHQAENAAVAIAAVETFIGGGAVRLADRGGGGRARRRGVARATPADRRGSRRHRGCRAQPARGRGARRSARRVLRLRRGRVRARRARRQGRRRHRRRARPQSAGSSS